MPKFIRLAAPQPFAIASVLIITGLVLSACTTQDMGQTSGIGASQIAPLKSDFGISPARSGDTAVNMAKVRQYPLHIARPAGAPQDILNIVSAHLHAIAARDAIPMTTAADSKTAYTLKGYFSDLVEDNQTTVLYVWDIIDPKGNRVHRMQGQEKFNGNGGWQAAKPQVLSKIADDTMAEYLRWLSGNG